MIVAGIKQHAHTHLSQVAHAFDSLRPGLGLPQRGQQDRGQNGYNRNDHQQLNQGEPPAALAPGKKASLVSAAT